jgi:hypothetical protein
MPVLRQFLTGFIDYAGLFPPAELEMAEAVRCYAEYRKGPDHELLGRFVVPASRMDEFAAEAVQFLERGDDSVPWCLSVLVDGDAAAARRSMMEFTAFHMSGSAHGHALCDAVEVKAEDEIQIKAIANSFPSPIKLFFEIGSSGRVEQSLEMIARHGGAAKIRTGGTKPEAFPEAETVIHFIFACHRLGIPFKATAGLHHAICGTYPLTYESDGASNPMFGYLNLLLASAFIRKGMTDRNARYVLEEDSIDEFHFHDVGVSWRGHDLNRDDLRLARSQLLLSFGSCSFSEPVNEARELGLI